MARNRNENVEPQQVVDDEGNTAPVTAQQEEQNVQQQQPREQQPQEQQRNVQGGARVQYVGRGAGFEDNGNRYEPGEVYEVDGATAQRLLSSKDAHGDAQFVQAD